MTFPQSLAEQIVFMDGLADRLNDLLTTTSPIILDQTNEPTQEEWEEEWEEAGNTLPIPITAELYWYNNETIKGIYGTFDDGLAIVDPKNATRFSGSSGINQWKSTLRFFNNRDFVFLYPDAEDGVVKMGKCVNGTFSQLTLPVTPVMTGIAVSPDKTQVAYFGAGNIHKINLNGTGDTVVLATAQATIYDWVNGVILYEASGEVSAVNDDGTGDAVVIPYPVNNALFNSDASRVYFAHNYEIRSIDTAGGGETIDYHSLSGTYLNIIKRVGTTYIFKDLGTFKRTDDWSTIEDFVYYPDHSDLFRPLEYYYDSFNQTAAPQIVKTHWISRDLAAVNTFNPDFYTLSTQDVSDDEKLFLFKQGVNNPRIVLSANRDEGQHSTGTVYRLSDWEADVEDFTRLVSFTPDFGLPTYTVPVPQTHDHLILLVRFGLAASTDTIILQFNGTTTPYYSLVVSADGTSVVKAEALALTGLRMAVGNTTDIFNMFGFIVNYKGNNAKTLLQQYGIPPTTLANLTQVGYWNATDAINSITLTSSAGAVVFDPAKTSIQVFGLNGKGRFWNV